ncbi:MAG: hypothetical protein Q9220_006617 [cf. Caloplaca sp. 1 TL-2023]
MSGSYIFQPAIEDLEKEKQGEFLDKHGLSESAVDDATEARNLGGHSNTSTTNPATSDDAPPIPPSNTIDEAFNPEPKVMDSNIVKRYIPTPPPPWDARKK